MTFFIEAGGPSKPCSFSSSHNPRDPFLFYNALHLAAFYDPIKDAREERARAAPLKQDASRRCPWKVIVVA
jgi:hypothetical protein